MNSSLDRRDRAAGMVREYLGDARGPHHTRRQVLYAKLQRRSLLDKIEAVLRTLVYVHAHARYAISITLPMHEINVNSKYWSTFNPEIDTALKKYQI